MHLIATIPKVRQTADFTEPTGVAYLVISTVVQDPDNLTEPFVTSSHFRKIPDSQGWDPTPCRAGVPR